MKNTQVLLGLLVVAIILGAFSALNQTGQVTNNEPIKIGFIGPLSGELASWGENQRSALELGLEQINSKGGVSGRKVEIVYEDSQCDPTKGVLAAKKLIEIDKVTAIVGDTCSSSVLSIAPIAEENKVILISPTAGSDRISDAGNYIFRVFLTNRLYAEHAAKLLRQEGKETAAVLYINNEFGSNWDSVFEKNFKELGGNILLSESYNPDSKDFRTALLKINSVNPNIVLLGGYYPDGARILTQAKELNMDEEFFGAGDGYDDPNLITLAGEAAEDFRFLSVPAGAGPSFDKFADAYRAKYKKEPPIYSDYAYDILMILAQAIQKTGTDSTAIKNALYKTDYAGASNRIRFDPNGDILDPEIVIKTVKNSTIMPST